jgi:poly(A) polymerase
MPFNDDSHRYWEMHHCDKIQNKTKIYPADRQHRMPIITPAYPSMCATHNVTQSTHTIMIEQFKEASELVAKIMVGEYGWDNLFVHHDFFSRYRHYLQIVAASKTKEQQLKWGGMVESRLRQLIMRLEVVDGIALAHPFIKGTDRNFICTSDEQWISIGHGTWPAGEPPSEEEMATAETDRKQVIYTTSFYVGLLIKPQPKSTNGNQTVKRQLDISWPSREFTELVKGWDQYESDDMSITVQNLKRCDILFFQTASWNSQPY